MKRWSASRLMRIRRPMRRFSTSPDRINSYSTLREIPSCSAAALMERSIARSGTLPLTLPIRLSTPITSTVMSSVVYDVSIPYGRSISAWIR